MMVESYLNLGVTLFLFLAVLPKSAFGQGVVQGSRHGPRTDCSKECRSDGVNVNISLNFAKDQTITFESPSGSTVTYERTNKPESSAKSSGSDYEDWHGTAGFHAANVIVRKSEDGNNIYTGSFVISRHICNLKHVHGEHNISCRHKSTYPPKMPPRVMYDASLRKSKNTNIFKQRKNVSTEQVTSTLGTMVVWTKKAECAASYEDENCELNNDTEKTMTDLINLAISETNTAYAESGINASLDLVHAYREPTYVEGGDNAFQDALDDITYPGDGKMDDVHTEREKYGADIVVLLIDDYQYCGMGWIGPYKEVMFSVTAQDCATGEYVFGHEIGHNMGCLHDRGTDNECDTNDYPGYAYGWRDPDGDFGTIMSYGCKIGECDSNPSDYCGIIQRFSSASKKIGGTATGNNRNDCARQHNDVRAEVAEYTATATNPTSDPPTPSPADCNGILLRVDLTCDNFPEETSWNVISTSNGNVVMANDGLSPGKTYTTSTCLTKNDSCFLFTITDSMNDGICCTFGSGSFKVTFGGDVILEGDEFGGSEEKDFCTSDSTPTISPFVSPAVTPTASPTTSPSVSPSVSPTKSQVTLAPVKFQCKKNKDCNDNDVCTRDKCKKKKCTNKTRKNKCCTNDADCVNTFKKGKCKVYECDTEKGRCKKVETLTSCNNKKQCKKGTCRD